MDDDVRCSHKSKVRPMVVVWIQAAERTDQARYLGANLFFVDFLMEDVVNPLLRNAAFSIRIRMPDHLLLVIRICRRQEGNVEEAAEALIEVEIPQFSPAARRSERGEEIQYENPQHTHPEPITA